MALDRSCLKRSHREKNINLQKNTTILHFTLHMVHFILCVVVYCFLGTNVTLYPYFICKIGATVLGTYASFDLAMHLSFCLCFVSFLYTHCIPCTMYTVTTNRATIQNNKHLKKQKQKRDELTYIFLTNKKQLI